MAWCSLSAKPEELLRKRFIGLPEDLARTIYDPSGYAGAVTFGDTTPLKVKKTDPR